jgi:hypothetical protein
MAIVGPEKEAHYGLPEFELQASAERLEVHPSREDIKDVRAFRESRENKSPA